MSLFSTALGTAGAWGGRALGNMVLPGIGGMVGGAAGGALGNWAGDRLRGGGGSATATPGDPRSMLLQRMQQQALQPFTSSPSYQAGRTELTTALGQQGDVDAARIASMGGAGGEADVAMAAGRGQALASGLTRLVGQSDFTQSQTAGQLLTSYADDRNRADNRSARRWGALGQAAATAGAVLPDLLRPRTPTK